LIPIIITKLKKQHQSKKVNFLMVVLMLIIIQMILSTIFSQSPVEQQIFGRTGLGGGWDHSGYPGRVIISANRWVGTD
jgi:hypothetical protein